MNEKIRAELARRAGFYANPDVEKFEKFAELIIKECIIMADQFEIDVNRAGLVDRIKQHFGVE